MERQTERERERERKREIPQENPKACLLELVLHSLIVQPQTFKHLTQAGLS